MSATLRLVKLTQKILSKFNRGGSMPGEIALRLDKNFIQKFKMPKTVILITGTNGKTSTSNMIAECLRANGLSVINNRKGDNINIGIATLLAASSDNKFNINADAAVIEVDELTVYRQFKNLKPTHFVITNFFRDQLDRAGEMETIIRRIEEVVQDFNGHLIFNGDDPNTVRIGESAKNATVHYYSVGECSQSKKETDEASEGKFCPLCGTPLVYDYYQYSHIGRFTCPNDGFGKIDSEIYVDTVSDKTFISEGFEYHPILDAIYNIYNCAAVLTVLKTMGLNYKEKADSVFSSFRVKEGRNEVFRFKKDCTLNLIKNPTGANEVMKYILKDDVAKNVGIILNDNVPDGKDVSWIWDAHFERLNVPSVKEIVCSGLRAYDMALRLKYEGLEDKVVVKEDIKDLVKYLKESDTESHIMSTYTALFKTRDILAKEQI